MLNKSIGVALLALLINCLPQVSQVATADTLLWESPLSGVSTAPLEIPRNATLRGVGTSIYQSNPDQLIFKIIMAGSLEGPRLESSRDLTVWIYWPFTGCWDKDKPRCDGLFTLSARTSSIYQTTKSKEFIYAVSHDKGSNINTKRTDCQVPWWISSSYYERDTVNFSVSITCLKIPKDFGFYGYSGLESNGQQINTFTDFQTTTNPFHNLASIASQMNPQISQPSICVTGYIGSGTNRTFLSENCVENSSWEFSYCDAVPLADLQVFKGKTWRKLQTLKGIKDDTQCDLSTPYFYNFTHSSLTEKFRIKTYGNKKYKTSFISLSIK